MFKKLGFFKNDLIKNILIVFSGNAIGLLIPFLGAFWIARLYKPEDLGYFSFIIVVINIIVLVSDLKLGERLIIEAKQEETGLKLLWGTANLFSNPRYAAGGATNPNPEVFSYAATQVMQAMNATKRLGGEKPPGFCNEVG
mgnify:CR=1 FL=1